MRTIKWILNENRKIMRKKKNTWNVISNADCIVGVKSWIRGKSKAGFLLSAVLRHLIHSRERGQGVLIMARWVSLSCHLQQWHMCGRCDCGSPKRWTRTLAVWDCWSWTWECPPDVCFVLPSHFEFSSSNHLRVVYFIFILGVSKRVILQNSDVITLCKIYTVLHYLNKLNSIIWSYLFIAVATPEKGRSRKKKISYLFKLKTEILRAAWWHNW